MTEPLSDAEVIELIRKNLLNGTLTLSRHALQRLRERNMDNTDAINVLRCGRVEGTDFEAGSWRYRVGTPRMCVVVAFRSETQMSVVTGWRKP